MPNIQISQSVFIRSCRPGIRLAVLLLVTLVCPARVEAQGWQSTGGPYSGEVTAVAVTAEGRLIVGTAGKGLFYRDLSEDEWTRSSAEAFDGITVRSIVVRGDRIIAATAGKGIWRSFDGGENWGGVNSGIGSPIVHALAVTSEGALYAGASSGLYRLSQSDQWVALSGGAQGHDIRTIAENSSGVLFAGSYGQGILRSTDGGLTWELLGNGLQTTIIRSLTVNSASDVFVGTFGGAVVQRSNDLGETWVPSGNGLDAQGVWSVAISPDGTYFAGARSEGIFRSSDGRNWSKTSAPATTVSGFVFGSGMIWAATRVGLLASSDGGDTWTLAGIPFSRVNALHVHNARVLAGLHLGGVHYSDAYGFGWRASGLNNEAVLRFAEDREGHLFAGTLGAGLFESADDGLTWTQIWRTVRVIYSMSVDTNNVVLTGTDSGVYRYSDDDMTFVNIGLTGIPIRTVLTTSTGILLAGSEREGIYRSTDSGGIWQQITNQLVGDDIAIWDLIERPGGQIAVATVSEGVWISDDQGASWRPLPGTGDVAIADLTISVDGVLYAVGFLGQVFSVHPGADVAYPLPPPFLSAPARAIAVPAWNIALIGTEPLGVYRINTVIQDVSDEAPMPPWNRLDIYPNPAVLRANVDVDVAASGVMNWEVVDVLGRTRRAGGHVTVSGRVTSFDVDLSGLSPGVYWVRVRGDGVEVVKSVVVGR